MALPQPTAIADSSSRNAVSFHLRAQRTAFCCRDMRLQSRLFAGWNQSLKPSSESLRHLHSTAQSLFGTATPWESVKFGGPEIATLFCPYVRVILVA